MSTPVATTSAAEPHHRSSAAAFVRSEAGVVALATAVLGLHIVSDNYLLPPPGTSPGDHTTSGLVPLGILVAAAVVYLRVPAGVRAGLAITLGALGLAVGFPGAYYLLNESASRAHYTGLAAIAAGLVLLAIGPVVLWRARRTGA